MAPRTNLPKLNGIINAGKMSEPKRDETVKRYLNRRYPASLFTKLRNRVIACVYQLPEVQEGIKLYDDLEGNLQRVDAIRFNYKHVYLTVSIKEYRPFAYKNHSSMNINAFQDSSSNSLRVPEGSPLEEALEDYDDILENRSRDEKKLNAILSKYTVWKDLFEDYPSLRILWEDDIDELYSGWKGKASEDPSQEYRADASLLANHPGKLAVEDFMNTLKSIMPEKLEAATRVEGQDPQYSLVRLLPEYDAVMQCANGIIEKLKDNPNFIHSTEMAAQYSQYVDTYDFVAINQERDYHSGSFVERIPLGVSYIGIKRDSNSSRTWYNLSTSLEGIASDLKVNALEECLRFTLLDAQWIEKGRVFNFYGEKNRQIDEYFNMVCHVKGISEYYKDDAEATRILELLREKNLMPDMHSFW